MFELSGKRCHTIVGAQAETAILDFHNESHYPRAEMDNLDNAVVESHRCTCS
jgi:hypothetical protein